MARLLTVCLMTFATWIALPRLLAAEASSRLTQEDGVCGSWQAAYTQLHQDILAGRRPPRYAITTIWSGLADAQLGVVSVFLYALITDRAFLWHYHNIEAAYASPNVNWTVPWGDGPPPGNSSTVVTYSLLNNRDGLRMDALWRSANLSLVGENASHVVFRAQRGMTYQLFDNPYHAGRLQALGLRPQTAFGCAMRFLLQLHPSVTAQLDAAAMAQIRDPSMLKIGIQIRTGDKAMGPAGRKQGPGLDQFKHFFDCAVEAGRTRGVGYPGGVRWYLISDSVSIRAEAEAAFGARLLHPLPHVAVGHASNPRYRPHNTTAVQALQFAAAENWLLGMMDVHIITRGSSFGRTSAFLSLKHNSIYTMTKGKRKCGPADFDPLDLASQHWARIM